MPLRICECAIGADVVLVRLPPEVIELCARGGFPIELCLLRDGSAVVSWPNQGEDAPRLAVVESGPE